VPADEIIEKLGMHGKILFLALISCAAIRAERPACYTDGIALTGDLANQIRLQMRDVDSPTASYTGHIYADDPTYSSTTDVVTVTTIGGAAVYRIKNETFGTGTKNLQDGTQHTLYFSMDTKTQGTLTNCTGTGWPYKFNVSRSANDYTYPLYTSAARGATPENLGVVANVSDPYSIGSTGTTICTVNGTPIKYDGVVGFYVARYAIPCSHVHTITASAASHVIPQAAMEAAYATLSPAFGPDEQFLALGWMFPTMINGITSVGTAGTVNGGEGTMSVQAYFATGGAIVTTTTIGASSRVVPGDFTLANAYFHSDSTTPFTDCNLRPTMMLAWAKCSDFRTPSLCADGRNVGSKPGDWVPNMTAAKAGIDASFHARDTNPRGGSIFLMNNALDQSRSVGYLMASRLAFGKRTAVAPPSLNVTTTVLTNATTTINSTGILGYELAAPNPNVASAPFFVARGTGYMIARTSTSGDLEGANQAPVTLYLLYGAAFSCGAGYEPHGMITTKYPEMLLLMSGYTRGMTAVEAVWKSTKQPFQLVCVGDPLTAPFSPQPGTPAPNAPGAAPLR
jgi:hypothetical protein